MKRALSIDRMLALFGEFYDQLNQMMIYNLIDGSNFIYQIILSLIGKKKLSAPNWRLYNTEDKNHSHVYYGDIVNRMR